MIGPTRLAYGETVHSRLTSESWVFLIPPSLLELIRTAIESRKESATL